MYLVWGIDQCPISVDNIPFGYRYMDEQKLFIQEISYISFREASASWRTSPKFNILKFLLIEKFF